MKNHHFKSITNIFKSKVEIERELATQHFYDSFKNENINPNIIDLTLSYLKSGFKIDISHKKYISKEVVNHKAERQKDPFEFVWLSLIWNSNQILSTEQNITENEIKETLLVILKEMVTDNYKKGIKNIDYGFLKEFSTVPNWVSFDNNFIYNSQFIQQLFVNVHIFKEYINTFGISDSLDYLMILNRTILKSIEFKGEEQESFENLKKELEDKQLDLELENKKNVINPKADTELRQETKFDIDKLSQLYNKPSQSIEIEKKDNLKVLYSLKKSIDKFAEKEEMTKQLCIKIFDDLDTLLNFPKLHMYKENQRYVTNLLVQHLPDTFNNYFELPIHYRIATDKITPQQVFEDILTEVDKKLFTMKNEIFQDNLTNLNIKKRFMKSI